MGAKDALPDLYREAVQIRSQLYCGLRTLAKCGFQGRCATEKDGFARAERLVSQMMRVVRRRKRIPAEIKKASNRRKRAFTRYQRDADAITPPLHATQKLAAEPMPSSRERRP